MSRLKKHIVSAEDFDAHGALSLISRKVGYKVTDLFKKEEVNRILANLETKASQQQEKIKEQK